jgi:hypothetical protein
MIPIHFSMLIHFIGLGMIFTAIFAGWILTGQYKRTKEWTGKALHLKSLRAIGLLSPIAVLVMLLSGIGNMMLGPYQYSLFSNGWLSTKLVFFVILAGTGIFFGIKGSKRTKLVQKIVAGTAPEGTEKEIRSLDRQQRWFYVLQVILLLIILTLSIVRPT